MDKDAMMEMREQINREEKARKLENYRQQNMYVKPGQILFTGSSLMEYFPISEYWMEENLTEKTGCFAYNRGIAGCTTDEFLQAIDIMMLDLEPSVIFINIGTNDITPQEDGSNWLDHLVRNYDEILRIGRESLDAVFYLMAYYPVCRKVLEQDPLRREKFVLRTKENLALANSEVEALDAKYGAKYIGVNEGLYDEDGDMKEDFTVEGVHMFSEAYRIVLNNLRPYLKR